MTIKAERINKITKTRTKQILNAAFNVFCSKGYGSAKISDIAAEASISVGTVYKYYRDKHTLFMTVVNEYILSEDFRNILKSAMGQDNNNLIKNILTERLGYEQEDLMKYFSLISEAIRNPSLRERFRKDILSPMLNMIELYSSKKIKSGMFRDIDHRLVTRAIGGMMIGLMILYATEGERGPLNKMPKEKIAEDISTIIFGGILKKEVSDGKNC